MEIQVAAPQMPSFWKVALIHSGETLERRRVYTGICGKTSDIRSKQSKQLTEVEGCLFESVIFSGLFCILVCSANRAEQMKLMDVEGRSYWGKKKECD